MSFAKSLDRIALAAAAALALALSGCAGMGGVAPAPTAETYGAVVASPIRTDTDRRTDAARHPAEFLAFAQVRPGMRVLDVSTGGGYTSQILALAIGPTGTLYAQAPNPGATVRARLTANPQANFVLVARPFEDPVPDEARDLDLVTLVLNYHDIAYLPVDRARMNQRIFAALKPGGRFVVVDHAARAGTGTADTRTLHRIDEAVVKSEVLEAGFVLEAEGTFLRNPDDPRDKSSGDSPFFTDKFVLRFRKPG